MEKVVSVMQQFGLDFDDAYQYVAAEQYKLIIISFDSDFDRSPLCALLYALTPWDLTVISPDRPN